MIDLEVFVGIVNSEQKLEFVLNISLDVKYCQKMQEYL